MFSERLSKLIEERGVSRYRISQDTKITEATLSNYCNEKGNPSPSIVKQLSDYFKVDYNWLLKGDAGKLRSTVSESGVKYKRSNVRKSDISTIISLMQDELQKKLT